MEGKLRLRSFLGKAYRWLLRDPLRKLKNVRYRVWLFIKQISFKDRDEKLREVEEILRENPNIYFTTNLVKTGFTDQLMGFTFLYKAGKGVGLKYYHTPLSSHRSSKPFLFDPLSKDRDKKKSVSEKSANTYQDVFDFLGLNDFLNKSSQDLHSKSLRKIQIDLKRTFFHVDNVSDYESLVEEMKVMLYSFINKRQKLLIEFQCDPRTYFKYYKYVHDHSEHLIDFRSIFNVVERDVQNESLFDVDSCKIMVHIRQGDTGIVKTPWGTFIPTWYQTEGKFTQFENEVDIPEDRMMNVSDFYQFLENLLSAINFTSTSALVFSDGFKKSFRWIYKYSNPKDISPKEINELKKLEPTYNENEFGQFEELKGVKTVIGEEVEKLYDLIHTFMEADIVVLGTHGIMTPKLAATFRRKENMPLLLMLYRGSQPNLSFIGFDKESDFLLYINLDDYNIQEVVGYIQRYQKQTASKS